MTTWYVRPLGASENTGRSFGNAKSDFDEVRNLMKSGDTVHIYNMNIPAQVIDKYGSTFVFHNAGVDATDSKLRNGLLVLSDYTTISGAEVFGAKGAGVVWAAGTDHGVFKNGNVHDNQGHGISSSGDSMKFLWNEVWNNYAEKSKVYAHTSGISIYRPEISGPQDMAYGVIVRGNTSHHNGNDTKTDASGIIVDWSEDYGKTILIKDNHVYENGGAGFLAYHSAHVLVEGGSYHDNSTDPLKGRPPELGVNFSHDITFRNVHADIGDDDPQDFVFKQGGGSYDIDLINNDLHGRIRVPEDVSPGANDTHMSFFAAELPGTDDFHFGVQSHELDW